MLNLSYLIDDGKCYETVRLLRWQDGIDCAKCSSQSIIKRAKDYNHPHRQRYQCKECGAHFDDLTNTIFAGHHQPLWVWILCLYFIGLNLSNRQIAQELDLDEGDVHEMTAKLRQGIIAAKPEVQLSGEVECDEVYVTAGHKGNPDAVRKKGAKDETTVSNYFGAGVPSQKKSYRYSA